MTLRASTGGVRQKPVRSRHSASSRSVRPSRMIARYLVEISIGVVAGDESLIGVEDRDRIADTLNCLVKEH